NVILFWSAAVLPPLSRLQKYRKCVVSVILRFQRLLPEPKDLNLKFSTNDLGRRVPRPSTSSHFAPPALFATQTAAGPVKRNPRPPRPGQKTTPPAPGA